MCRKRVEYPSRAAIATNDNSTKNGDRSNAKTTSLSGLVANLGFIIERHNRFSYQSGYF